MRKISDKAIEQRITTAKGAEKDLALRNFESSRNANMRTEAASYVIINTYHDTTCSGDFHHSMSNLADHCIKLHDEEYGKSMEYTAGSLNDLILFSNNK